MPTFEGLGHFLFRWRNLLFPVLVLGVFVVFPSRAMDAELGVALLLAGIAGVVLGQGLRVLTIGLDYIRRGGRDGRVYADRLVTGGIFAHCRNPMYTGNILLVLGFLLISGNLAGVIVGGLLALPIYRAIVHSEERYLAATFGAAYRDYCRRVPRWIPRVGGVVHTLRRYRFDWAAVVLREYGTLYMTALLLVGLLAWKTALAGGLERLWLPYLALAIALTLAYAWARYLKKSRRLRPLRG